MSVLAFRALPGKVATVDPMLDAPRFDCFDADEVKYLLDYLVGRNLLEPKMGMKTGPNYIGNEVAGYRLTIPGWESLEPGRGGIPGRCFIAMWFDVSMLPAYADGIYPAIKADCQMEPDRVDQSQSNDRIDDRIIAAIRAAEFTVADVTGQRPNVYLEAGFALALGRPVIWTAREGETLHFDVRQFPLIEWQTPGDLREKLRDRVLATIPSARRRG